MTAKASAAPDPSTVIFGYPPDHWTIEHIVSAVRAAEDLFTKSTHAISNRPTDHAAAPLLAERLYDAQTSLVSFAGALGDWTERLANALADDEDKSEKARAAAEALCAWTVRDPQEVLEEVCAELNLLAGDPPAEQSGTTAE